MTEEEALPPLSDGFEYLRLLVPVRVAEPIDVDQVVAFLTPVVTSSIREQLLLRRSTATPEENS